MKIRAFLASTWNEVRMEFSERGTIIFFAVLPLLFTAVVGLGLGGIGSDGESGEDSRIAIAVVNQDSGDLSGMFLEALGQSNAVRPVTAGRNEALEYFKAGEAYAVLTIPAGFSQEIQTQTQADLPLEVEQGTLASTIISEHIRAAGARTSGAVLAGISSLETAAEIRPFESAEAEQQYLDDFYTDYESMYDPPPIQMQAEPTGVLEPAVIAAGFNQSSPGQLVTWTLITFLETSIVFVNERRMGTLRRLLTMPVPRALLLGGKVSGRLLLGLIQMALLIVSGVLVFNVPWGGSPAALAILSVSFGLAATSIGLFIATIVKTSRQASSMSVILSMALAALGGAWWPLEITGETYRSAVQVLPTTWAMRGYSDIILRGQGVSGILLESAVLLGFALVFFVLSWKRFRFE